ncbi:hypothetical protein ACFLRY_00680 [Bacteroidota bacterium]
MKAISRVSTIVIMLSLFLTGCDFEVTTANIKDVKVCDRLSGELCGQDSPIFMSRDPQIFVSCKLKNAPENTIVTFIWKYVEGDPIIIDKVTVNSSDQGLNLDLNSSLSRPNNGWPTGKYEVEIRVGGTDGSPEVKSFEVR